MSNFKNILLILIFILTIKPLVLCQSIQVGVKHFQGACDEDFVYIASSMGVCVYDKNNDSMECFNDDNYLNISAIAVSDEGDIVVGTYSKIPGIAYFRNKKFEEIKCNAFPLQNVSKLMFDDGLWVGSNYYISNLNEGEWREWSYFNKNLAYCKFSEIITNPTSGDIWFGMQTNGKNEKLGKISQEGEIDYYQEFDNIKSLYLDKNELYIATDKGLHIMKDEKIVPFEEVDNPLVAKCDYISGQDGVIWFSSGTKLIRKNMDGSFDIFNCGFAQEDDTIVDIICDNEILWLILFKGGLVKFDNRNFIKISGVDEISNNDIVENKDMFDLLGRRINQYQTGNLYISNGKKIITK